VEAGQGVIWDRFAPVLRGLVEKSNGFRTAMEAFRSKISGRYFVTCANVRYPQSVAVPVVFKPFPKITKVTNVTDSRVLSV
jgi:hypothetical protein